MLFGLASLVLVLYGVIIYDANAVCYEIIPPQGRMDTVLLDKCRGQTLTLIKKDFDEDEDGKTDGYTYRWATIGIAQGSEPFWKENM